MKAATLKRKLLSGRETLEMRGLSSSSLSPLILVRSELELSLLSCSRLQNIIPFLYLISLQVSEVVTGRSWFKAVVSNSTLSLYLRNFWYALCAFRGDNKDVEFDDDHLLVMISSRSWPKFTNLSKQSVEAVIFSLYVMTKQSFWRTDSWQPSSLSKN